jgi:hypothetical protein
MKSTLFTLPVIFFFTFGSYKTKAFFIGLGFFTGVSLSLLIEGLDIFDTLITFRMMITPANTQIFYFEYFEGNHTYLSQSFLRHFIEPTIKEAAARIIGKVYFNSEHMHANTGFPSDAYMNFGAYGFFIFGLIYALVFSYLSKININPKYFGIIFLYSNSIVATSLTTIMLTLGMSLMIVVFALFLKRPKFY